MHSVVGSSAIHGTQGVHVPRRNISATTPRTGLVHRVCARAASQHGCIVSKLLARRPLSCSTRNAASHVARVAVSAPLDASPHDAATDAADTNEDTFVWTKNWYPVAVTESLLTDRPNPITLLGRDFVLWVDSKDEWRCVEDRCPHRLAPMSEGRVVGDTLECSYHGWRFDAGGNCTHVPAMPTPEIEAKIKENKKSCIASFPVQVRMGLVFLWPESGPLAWIESVASDAHVIPELEDESYLPESGRWTMTDMPYSWDFFIENVVDPLHVNFAHHGVADINRSKAEVLTLETAEPLTAKRGFKNNYTTAAGKKSSHEFRPPGLVLLKVGGTGKTAAGFQALVLYAVPIRPGWVRHIGCTFLSKEMKGTATMLAFFTSGAPAWLRHYFAPAFLYGDLILLHGADRIYHSEGSDWRKSYFPAVPADKGVAEFRRWMDVHAGGRVPFPAHMEDNRPLLSREQMLDTYHQHTKNCKICTAALKNTGHLQTAAYAGAFLAVAMAVLSSQAAAHIAQQLAASATAAATATTPAVATAAAAAAAASPVVSVLSSLNPSLLLVLSGLLLLVASFLHKFKQGWIRQEFVRPL